MQEKEKDGLEVQRKCGKTEKIGIFFKNLLTKGEKCGIIIE